MTAEGSAPAGQLLTITVPASSGLYPPLEGLDQAGGSIAVEATVGGVVMEKAMVQNAPLIQAALVGESEVWFEAQSRAGRPAHIALNISTSDLLLLGAGSGVRLHLPRFFVAPISSDLAPTDLRCGSSPAGLVSACTWDPTSEIVAFTLAGSAGTQRPFSLSVLLRNDGGGQLSLPISGVSVEDRPWFTVQQAGGAILGPAYVKRVQRVGSFHADSAVSFLPVAEAGAVVGLRVSLTPYMRLES
eukprot:1236363-Rhodomonas_salina.2